MCRLQRSHRWNEGFKLLGRCVNSYLVIAREFVDEVVVVVSPRANQVIEDLKQQVETQSLPG